METLGFVLTALGAVASLAALYLAYPRPGSWRSVSKAVRAFVKRMHMQGFLPDIVVMYGRGGAVLGGLLAGNLGNLPVTSIDRRVLVRNGTTGTRLRGTHPLAGLNGKTVLLVTGEVITGNQLRRAKAAVARSRPAVVKTASYYVCSTASVFPDYYARETKGPLRVPWRLLPDYRRDSKPGLHGEVV